MKAKEYLQQLSIVILGVLIAFGISNLGVKYQERNNRRQVLRTIKLEIEDNMESVLKGRKNIELIQKTFSGINADQRVDLNYNTMRLHDMGYETAKNSGVLKDMKYELVSAVVHYYESVRELRDFEDEWVSELFVMVRNPQKVHVDFLVFQLDILLTIIEELEVQHARLMDKLNVYLKRHGR